MKKKVLISIIAIAVVACLTVGGTLAYLTSVQSAIKNIFTIGKIDITFEEEGGEPEDPENPNSPRNYTLIPNTTVKKDAVVTVGATSLDSYIFAVVDEECTAINESSAEPYAFTDYVTYAIDEAWTKLDGFENVYYLKYTANDEGAEYHLITDTDEDDAGDVTVNDLDDALIEAADGASISLSFQIGAVQADGLDGETDADKIATAWAAIEDQFTVTIVAAE